MAAKGTSGSYYEDYMRSNAMLKHGGDRNAKQLLTDRNAYISFLEVQLERVSAACLSAQTFEKRLAELEAAQISNDQKVSSLSKVFRLNQEYVEQTTEQSRSELSAFAAKMDSWMEKYSTELHAHEKRLTQGEELMRRSDSFLEAMSTELKGDLDQVKMSLESETQDLKTLVFAAQARIDSMQNAQGDADHHLEIMRQLVTDRLDEDLERIRMSLSEKYITMEQKHEELRQNVKSFATEMESGWKADLARRSRSEDDQWKRLNDRVDRMEHETIGEVQEVKAFLRKCLDAQHLLSTTVVGLQDELDDKRVAYKHKSKLRGAEAANNDHLVEAIEELRTTQHRIKEALRVVQACSRESQLNAEAQCDRLADRLDSTEKQFVRLTHESLAKADEMRNKVLIALGEVEQKLRHDADAVAGQAVESVRSESKMYISQFLETTSRLEARLDEVEIAMHEIETQRIHVRVPTNPVHRFYPQENEKRGDTNELSGIDVARLTEAVTRSVGEQISSMVSALRDENGEAHLNGQAHHLESRTNRNALRAEENVASMYANAGNRQEEVRPKRAQAPHATTRSCASSSSTTSSPTVKRTSAIMKQKPTGQTRTNERRRESAKVSNVSQAKASRLKELCLELVAMEGSIKGKTRSSSKVV